MPDSIEDAVTTWLGFKGRSPSSIKDWVSVSGLRFSFYKCILSLDSDKKSKYKAIIGFVASGSKLTCRAWYYSRSESSWRAYTGTRAGGAWKKGAEGVGGEDKIYTNMGYVFECYATIEMATALDAYWRKNDPDHILTEVDCLPFGVEYEFICAQDGSDFPGITKEYASERNFYFIALPDDEGVKEITDKSSGSSFQAFFGKGKKNDIGSKIRTTSNMEAWLSGCLKHERGIQPSKMHDILGMTYTVFSYALRDVRNNNLVVEIAATDELYEHHFYAKSGLSEKLSTKICWVRDIYLENSPISNFGTRKNIPINASFIIQKPIDYIQQVSDEYKISILSDEKRKGALKLDEEMMVEADNYKKSKLEKDKKSMETHRKAYEILNNRYNNTVKTGLLGNKSLFDGGRYLILSALNEATSTLIAEFKKNKKIPAFGDMYSLSSKAPETYGSAYLLVDHGSRDTEASQAAMLRLMVFKGITEYHCLRTSNNGVYQVKWNEHHGSAGLDRAEGLRVAVSKANTRDEISKALYECFANDSFFSKIRANQTSLFTCVCRNILVDIRVDEKELPAGHPGPEGAIPRMEVYIRKKAQKKPETESMEVFITNSSPQLLEALRSRK